MGIPAMKIDGKYFVMIKTTVFNSVQNFGRSYVEHILKISRHMKFRPKPPVIHVITSHQKIDRNESVILTELFVDVEEKDVFFDNRTSPGFKSYRHVPTGALLYKARVKEILEGKDG